MPDPAAEEAPLNSEGSTASERYLSRLAKKSFLSLWSYSNTFTDEGRPNGKGDGKELCDLLVVFDRDVLIFSDKHCEFPSSKNLEISWARWYRRAVDKSVRQLLGARSWITRFPNRIFLDGSCQRPFPLNLPSIEQLRFHLVAVTRGAYAACRDHFAGQSTGSLMINTSVVGPEHHSHPFTIGRVLPQGPYIHVLDELTLEVVLSELDTIKDLVEYLERKETLLTHPQRNVISSGEEQLVAMYLTRVDDSGRHSFAGIRDDIDGVYIEEGHWEDFIQNSQYLAKKRADEKSYAWDRLIEHLTARAEVGLGDDAKRDLAAMEPALRALASEPRLARRQLADQLVDAMSKSVAPGHRFLRLGYAKQTPDTAYVFLILPWPPYFKTYPEYREGRRALLLASCKVARLRATSAVRIIGIATEPLGTRGATEDLVLLSVEGDAWGEEQEKEARQLQAGASILLDETVQYFERHDDEYPKIPTMPPATSPSARLLERARLRNLEKLAKKGRSALRK